MYFLKNKFICLEKILNFYSFLMKTWQISYLNFCEKNPKFDFKIA